jgi:hypothetical protein
MRRLTNQNPIQLPLHSSITSHFYRQRNTLLATASTVTVSARFATSVQPLCVSACNNQLFPHSSPRSETLFQAVTHQLNDAQHRHVTKVTSIFVSLVLCGPANQKARDYAPQPQNQIPQVNISSPRGLGSLTQCFLNCKGYTATNRSLRAT